MRTVGIIPARYQSSRFPGKPLVELNGVPMIVRVARIVEEALGKRNTYVATDDKRIKDVAEAYGFQVILTSSSCLTGTDRVYEASKKIDADIFVNIQGDEPLLASTDIRHLVKVKKKSFSTVVNGMCQLGEEDDPNNRNIPKVACTDDGRLIYMSRAPIPSSKDPARVPKFSYFKQVCIYCFNKEELEKFGSTKKKSYVEDLEDIEILRFFQLGISVKMVETTGASLAIDVPADVEEVERKIAEIEQRKIS